MKRLWISLLALVGMLSLVLVACSQAAPVPTQAPSPPKPAEPTKAAAPAPTAAPAAAAPTKAPEPAKKVDFPQKGKSITFIVPWGAGGGTDVGARVLAEYLEKVLATPIQVVNKAGANSQVGVTEAAKAKPDGYTIVMTNLPSSITPYLDPERQAAYGRKDLVQVANQVWDPTAMAVKEDSPHKSVKDVADALKAGNKVVISDVGILSDTHLGLLLFLKEAGIKPPSLVHFEGGSDLMPALLGGKVDVGVRGIGGFTSQYKSKQIRLLGVMDTQRLKLFADVPTFEEQGFKVQYASSRGVSVPAGTPKEIVDVLDGAIKKVMEDEAFKKRMDESGLALKYLNAAEYTKYWDEFETATKPLIALGKE